MSNTAQSKSVDDAEGKAFIDARCPECNRRIGWFGTMLDHPGCKCGYKPDKDGLIKDQEEIKKFEEFLIAKAFAKENKEFHTKKKQLM